jgi:hypothetical protein
MMQERQKHRTVDVRKALGSMMAQATRPVAPLSFEGTDPTTQKGNEVLIGLFAMGAVAMSVVTYIKATETPFLAAIPLLFAALLVSAIWSARKNLAKMRSSTAETLLGHGQDNVVNAIQQFQAETEVPLRIIIRDQIPNIEASALQLFAQCEKEGTLDSRGVLFVLSAKTGGYALVLGPVLARKTPDITPAWLQIARFGPGRYEARLIASLQALRPQMAQLFPRTPASPRPVAQALDIRS